ncbi:DUF159-domain-containing protein [Neolentinus lepideus HHB14362 ss-1]|uniref:DUF159-domain-containing protein n=1 Tax=Neolentinus lepideus HHB14362 ss-1 TaxID=1314782 RepID=A0A165QY62_9AGAM|nr:DUF159-domain-containing protein [Neolentinus lepideus HHB14362 ss-1]
MCGRFALALPHHEIQQLPGHGVQVGEWIDQDQFYPRYNIAPRSRAPVIRRDFGGPFEECSRGPRYVLQTMKWGLVPHWSKHEDKSLSTTNARAENLVEGGGIWGPIKGKKRCAVICQGYYEWLKKGKDKLPHFTKHKDERVMLLAGLWDSVVLEGETQPLYTFTVVTTDANKEFTWLHDRQPVILSTQDALEKWLDTSGQTWTPELAELVKPYHDSEAPLECVAKHCCISYQVPKEVGKTGTESPSFIQPISQRKDGIESMFAKAKQKQIQSANKLKRKRSSSPLLAELFPDLSQESNVKQESGDAVKLESQEATSSKTKLNTWEDDELEYTDDEPKAHSQPMRDVVLVDSDAEDANTPDKRPTKVEASLKDSPSKKKAPNKKPKGTKEITAFFKKV